MKNNNNNHNNINSQQRINSKVSEVSMVRNSLLIYPLFFVGSYSKELKGGRK